MSLRALDVFYAAVSIFSFGLTISACATTQLPESLQPEYHQRVIQTDPKEPYYHPGSNVMFPVIAGAFTRSRVSAYGPGTVDVSGHYINELLGAIATVYFYPGTSNPKLSTEEVREHYEDFKEAIVSSHPGAELVDDRSGTFSVNNTPTTGLYAIYHLYGIGDSYEEMDSHFFLFPFGAWYLKFRITHPTRSRTDATREIPIFLDSLWWSKSDT